MKKLAFSLLTAVCIIPLHAGNLVVNPSFEDPTLFNGWLVTTALEGSDISVVSAPLFSPDGENVARFGGTTPGSYDQISQTISTVNGQAYVISFLFQDAFPSNPGEPPAALINRNDPSNFPLIDFQAIWDGSTFFDSQGGSVGFNRFTFTVMGTGSDTLQFIGYNNPSFSFLDQVSVEATPEPASFALIGGGLAAVGLIRKRRVSR